MVSSLAKILKEAQTSNYGVGCFNVFGYEDARSVVHAAQAENMPVILAANLDMVRFMPLKLIVATFESAANMVDVPVGLHLDHTYEIDAVKAGIDAGFTSVMYDGSQLPLAENVKNTTAIVSYAKARGVSVEAELGSVPYASGRDHIKSEETNPNDVLPMMETGIDALAISIGNVHRLEKADVTINFDLLKKIEAITLNRKLPLVIHGTSGIVETNIARLAKTSVCKFNIGTRIRQVYGKSYREILEKDQKIFDRLSLMKHAIQSMQDEAGKMIRLLKG